MVWHSHLFQNFPQFIVIHTVKGLGIVNKAEIDVFLELFCLFDDPDVGNLISGFSIKDRNGMDLTEAEDIKKRWQEYTEELYKKDLYDPDNHDGVITHLLLLLLLSHFSRVRLCATPWTAAHQAPLSLGFSRQEHWSGLPFPSPMHESGK